MRKVNLSLTPLTPIHVGSGEVITPLEYTLRPIADGYDLCRFDPMAVMARLAWEDRPLAESIAGMSDFRSMALRLHGEIDEQQDLIYRIPADSIAETYMQRRADPDNQLLVKTMQRDPTSSRPLIPGSTLKGAIRTALMHRAVEAAQPRGRFDNEASLLRGLGWSPPQVDPMRAVRLSDCLMPPHAQQFVAEVSNYSSQKDKLNSIQMICEQIDGIYGWGADGIEPGVCEMRIDTDLASTNPLKSGPGGGWAGLRDRFDIETIAAACNRFYGRILREEDEKFYRRAQESRVKDAAEQRQALVAQLDALPERSFVVRVGRFSHFESVTLPDLAVSRRPRGRSRNLSNGQVPLGWLLVEWDDHREGRT